MMTAGQVPQQYLLRCTFRGCPRRMRASSHNPNWSCPDHASEAVPDRLDSIAALLVAEDRTGRRAR